MSPHHSVCCSAALAASLLLAPAVSQAAFVGDSQQPSLAALDFLSQANKSLDSTASSGAAAQSAALGYGRRSRWPDKPLQARGESDLLLWNLLSITHAQRDGRYFALADRNVSFVLTNVEQPSAVPLPGALWLFVSGLLGLAGTRLTGRRKQQKAAGNLSAPAAGATGPTPVPA